MSDIVERLRALYRGYRQHYIIADAADEIERLRAELATSREMCTKFELAVGDDLGEIMQLRAQLEQARDYVNRAIVSYDGDSADNNFQRGFLAALEVVRDEAFSPLPSTEKNRG
jgi:hypothetical protein